MTRLVHVATLTDPETTEGAPVTDLTIAEYAEGPLLYATSLAGGKTIAYTISGDGAATFLAEQPLPEPVAGSLSGRGSWSLPGTLSRQAQSAISAGPGGAQWDGYRVTLDTAGIWEVQDSFGTAQGLASRRRPPWNWSSCTARPTRWWVGRGPLP